ncbi:hypothetical protein ACRALDRAFT_210909 [Sodiomyces alcalophilus JCM 7366]|uniref:uncharacterized protein n=1 Tax=Sodiomyces alcalophilus JCM 7366 TaxID=591952 RepID=UPI0039B438C1
MRVPFTERDSWIPKLRRFPNVPSLLRATMGGLSTLDAVHRLDTAALTSSLLLYLADWEGRELCVDLNLEIAHPWAPVPSYMTTSSNDKGLDAGGQRVETSWEVIALHDLDRLVYRVTTRRAIRVYNVCRLQKDGPSIEEAGKLGSLIRSGRTYVQYNTSCMSEAATLFVLVSFHSLLFDSLHFRGHLIAYLYNDNNNNKCIFFSFFFLRAPSPFFLFALDRMRGVFLCSSTAISNLAHENSAAPLSSDHSSQPNKPLTWGDKIQTLRHSLPRSVVFPSPKTPGSIVQKSKSQSRKTPKDEYKSRDADLCIEPRLMSKEPLSLQRHGSRGRRLPAPSAIGWGAGIGTCKVVECHLGSIFLCIVEVLAIIPEPRCESPPLNRDAAGPSCAATWVTESDREPLHQILFATSLTSAVGNDLKDRRHDLRLATSIYHLRISAPAKFRNCWFCNSNRQDNDGETVCFEVKGSGNGGFLFGLIPVGGEMEGVEMKRPLAWDGWEEICRAVGRQMDGSPASQVEAGENLLGLERHSRYAIVLYDEHGLGLGPALIRRSSVVHISPTFLFLPLNPWQTMTWRGSGMMPGSDSESSFSYVSEVRVITYRTYREGVGGQTERRSWPSGRVSVSLLFFSSRLSVFGPNSDMEAKAKPERTHTPPGGCVRALRGPSHKSRPKGSETDPREWDDDKGNPRYLGKLIKSRIWTVDDSPRRLHSVDMELIRGAPEGDVVPFRLRGKGGDWKEAEARHAQQPQDEGCGVKLRPHRMPEQKKDKRTRMTELSRRVIAKAFQFSSETNSWLLLPGRTELREMSKLCLLHSIQCR